VRLTRKLAERLNGVDLSRARAGEEIELFRHEADILIAEGWAVPADEISVANDKAPRRQRKATQL
jgi:hypothetical protein